MHKTHEGAQNQHYVSKFILRNFLAGDRRKEQVHVYDKSNGKTFRPNISGIMAERRFNEFVIDDNWLASFEPSMCRIEEQVLPVYRDVVSNRRLRHTFEERGFLAYLTAFQMVRTRAQRDRFTEVDRAIRDKWEQMGAPDDQLTQFDHDSNDLVWRHAKFIDHAMKDFAKIISTKDYYLVEAAPGRSFYLADNPVALHNSRPSHDFYGNIGLSVPGIEIYLPLTSDLLLVFWCPGIIDKHRQETRDQKNRLAGALLANVMKGHLSAAYMKRDMHTINVLAGPIEELISAVDTGQPYKATDGTMDFYNSLQMHYAARQVISQDGSWEIARRFMQGDHEPNTIRV